MKNKPGSDTTLDNRIDVNNLDEDESKQHQVEQRSLVLRTMIAFAKSEACRMFNDCQRGGTNGHTI